MLVKEMFYHLVKTSPKALLNKFWHLALAFTDFYKHKQMNIKEWVELNGRGLVKGEGRIWGLWGDGKLM